MRQLEPRFRPPVWSLAALALALAACPITDPPPPPPPPPPPAADWRNEVIYFAVTDRFANGNVTNDNGGSRDAGDRADRTNPLGWHGGDIAGLRQKVEEGYFRRLGFTALWISPVVLQVPSLTVNDANSPNNGKANVGYHGYWAEDFLKVDPHFGTLDELKAFVKVAHDNGLKVIQDVVVNHAGYESSLVAQHPDWFRTQAECDASADKDKDCPLAGLPDFKQDKPEVVAYLNEAVNFLVRETGIDGIRMDTMKQVADSYWRQFFKAGGAGDPKKVWTVGEVFNGDPGFVARYMNDLGSPSVFDFPLYFAIKDQLSSAGGSLDALGNVFSRDGAYADPSRLTTFVDNHDVKRFVSEATERGASTQAAAERLDAALSLIYASRGTPSVYYGSEIAMAGKGDPYGQRPGESNREDMNFGVVAGSPLAARLKALADARKANRALTHGTQQELYRPNGAGAALYAFRRTMSGSAPVVAVLNNSDAAVALSSLPAGGIPLLGTFARSSTLREVTGKASDLSVDADGRLVGTVPPRTLLLVSGQAGSGFGTNPALPNVTNLAAVPGDAAVKITWTPTTSPEVGGYRAYSKAAGASGMTQVNFAPLPRTTSSTVVQGLTNGTAYEFTLVTVDAEGRESVNAPKVSATPQASITAAVTFTVDARSQGEAALEVRRFDTGSQLEYALTKDPARRGYWTGTVQLPLFREVKFKFGNDAAGAKNSGYEGPGQPDRSLVVDTGATFTGTYDFITAPAPNSAVQGFVRSGAVGLAGALVESSANPDLNYAIAYADGSYYLPIGLGVSSQLTAKAQGYTTSSPQTATAPATVDFNLSSGAATRYVIDGNLADWTPASIRRLQNPSPTQSFFGPDNRFNELLVDWDATYLYLAYRYRASGNSAIVYLDTAAAGGAAKADDFEAWKRAVDFANPVNFLLARYQNEDVQLRQIVSGTSVPQIAAGNYRFGKGGTSPENTSELAIPWTSLGFAARPTATLGFYAGVFGGDGYGAGDIAPNPGSTPSGANTISSDPANRRVSYQAAFSVPITP